MGLQLGTGGWSYGRLRRGSIIVHPRILTLTMSLMSIVFSVLLALLITGTIIVIIFDNGDSAKKIAWRFFCRVTRCYDLIHTDSLIQ